MGPDAWWHNTVAFLRSQGFFAAYAGLSEEELVGRLRAASPRELDPWGDWDDLLLASLDQSRLWWRDTEIDIAPGRNAYVQVLQEWADISRGAFAPSGIRESWEGDRLLLTMQVEGREVRLEPRVQGDWLDLDLLEQINRLMEPSGCAFALCKGFDQTAQVLVVTPAERRAFEERGWEFAPLPPAR